MYEIPLKQVIDSTLDNLKNVLSTDTVIGEPITVGEGTIIIPISKVSVGFTSGGVDFDGKSPVKRETPHFGGGNAAGMSVTPKGFLVINGNDVKLLNIENPTGDLASTVTELINKSPEFFAKAKDFFKKGKEKKTTTVTEEKITVEENVK